MQVGGYLVQLVCAQTHYSDKAVCWHYKCPIQPLVYFLIKQPFHQFNLSHLCFQW